ncbi:acetylornithine transaminase [Gracilibacillus alcaliphilus]|uniref:acetylornithine transaminase n=1 Tax=Gracilibacillus alcaliphilus TaxID=1401441 RepID=UPI00195B9AF5|nr:acetylornithine transaminase [Gracilibacillus alcaliphilus]MBM7677096.1 acetylornithine aminotransferase [Gracilibacillus alcaliphilus]
MSNQTSNAVMSTYGRFPISIVEGKGSYVWDDKGTKYLDYVSGLATCNLGHVPDAVEEAVQAQLSKLWHCTNLYHIPTQEQLAEKLAQHSCGDQVFFCNSGAEANEAAIKIAKKYGHDVLKQDNPLIVTFQNSFHGRTMATLTATGQEKIQQGFAPLTPGFTYLSYNDNHALSQLQELSPVAVMLELVQGEGGVIPVEKEWIQQLEAICQEQGILLMVDEIQTGMGRTGKLFAYEHYQIEPDVITIAKGLGSGLPIGAMIAKEEVAKVFSPGTHGSTFGGNPVSTTAGLATIDQLTTPGVLEHAQEMADLIWQGLEQLAAEKEEIKSVRGKGLLIGLEVTGAAIDYVNKAREEEQLLIVVAGPHIVRILPPLTTTKAEAEQFLEKINHIFQ